MAEVFYEALPATDGVAMNPVPDAVFQVFEIADTTYATPLSLRVGAGNPSTTVTASSPQGIVPGTYVTSPNFEHNWKSGDFVWRRNSFDGAKKAVETAKNAAEDVAARAQNGEFKGDKGDPGDKGLDGSNVLPTSEAIQQELQFGPSAALLSATTVGKYADIHADFTGVTTRPTKADSGQAFAYTYTGANNIVIQNGLLINDGSAGQYYMDTPDDPLSGPVTSVGVECVFFAGTESGMVYGSWSTPITNSGGWSGQKSRVHAILYPGRLEYYINETGAAPAAVLIRTQTLPTPLTKYADQTAWINAGKPTNKVVTLISGDTAVTIVNGVALPPITHAGINGTDRYPFWEAYKPVVGMKALWAGTTPELLTGTADAVLSQAVASAQKKADDAYTAAPTTIVRMNPQDFVIRTGSPSLGMNGIDMPNWAFDQSAVENLRGYAVVPQGWATYDVVLVTANNSAAAGDVRLQTSVSIVGNDGAAIFGGHQTTPQVTVTAAAQGVRKDIVAVSNVARAATGQIVLTLSRVASDALDTLAGDYGIAFVELRKKS